MVYELEKETGIDFTDIGLHRTADMTEVLNHSLRQAGDLSIDLNFSGRESQEETRRRAQ